MIEIKCWYVCLVLISCWSYVNSCTTPLGQRSQCVPLYDCPELLAAFNNLPLSGDVITFLRQSQCGFDGSKPTVCCGPLPSRPTPLNYDKDPVSNDDSIPAQRGQCGKSSTDKIFGGTQTELEEFPWMVLLGYRTRNGTLVYQCGGVLVNRRYVLTAAHCVIGAIEDQVGKLAVARLGEYDLRTNPDCSDGLCADAYQEIEVDIAFAHTGYNDANKNRQDDIAILRLKKRVKLNYYVKPICLADYNTRLNTGFVVTVAGWGKTLEGGSSPVKQKLNLPVYDKERCEVKFTRFNARLTEKQFCAGGLFAQDACQGDSGGPLMLKNPDGTWDTVGVVSFGYGCGREGWPGVYTSIAAYRDWIESTIQASNV